MIKLFKMCLNAEYVQAPESGDYAMCVDGDTLYLLFQHSNGKEDWKNNFDFPVTPYKDMSTPWYCHRGFLRVWKAMRDEVEAEVVMHLRTNPQIVNIVCVGYSHGAALSVLATEDMSYLHGDKYAVSGYGFGAPRVLWGVVPEEVKERLKCFTTIRNIPDIVTHVPPVLFGFRNAGQMVKIGKSGKYNPVKAHYPEVYIAELENHASV